MRERVGRKWGVLDAMILVAMVAGWLTATRHLRMEMDLRQYLYPGEYGLLRFIRTPVSFTLLFLSTATLLIRLRPPTPSRRRLWRQPGLAASAAVVLGLSIKVVSDLVLNMAIPGRHIPPSIELLRDASPYCGPAVAGAWLALILTRRWRAERSGVDRLGRILGACWLIEFLIAEMPGRRWVAILGNLASEALR